MIFSAEQEPSIIPNAVKDLKELQEGRSSIKELPISSCSNCNYWHGNEFGVGSCRRRPPQLVSGYGVSPVWPITGELDWCGEWDG